MARAIKAMLTTSSPSRLFKARKTYKPFDYAWAIQAATDHQDLHWVEAEAKVGQDVADWNTGKLIPPEKFQIREVLKLFTQQDLTVAGFYSDILCPFFKNNDIAMMLRAFNTREDTHQRAYALLNDTLGLPESDYSAFLQEKELADKVDFAMEADPSTIPGIAQALVKGVINEGLSLFGSFVPLLNYQRRGLMKGMGTVVEWSVRDETQHVIGITRLFQALIHDHPEVMTDDFKRKVYQMFRDAIDLEDAFIDRIYQMGPVEGLKIDDLKLYMRYLADRRLLHLGFKANWNIDVNPLEWLDWILSAVDHSNFFEKKVTEYEVGGLQGDINYDRTLVEPLMVYTKAGCGYCVKAKSWLDLRGIAYRATALDDEAERLRFYDDVGLVGSARTMPQIFAADGTRIGGFSELSKLGEPNTDN